MQRTERSRLRDATKILRDAIDQKSGVLAMTRADGSPASADEVLNAVLSYATGKIRRVDQRLPLTAEMVPHRLAHRIRRDFWRELRCEYRYPHIDQYVELKYRTPLTQEVLEGLKKCFPRGMLPTWAEIEAQAEVQLSKDPDFTLVFLTPTL